MEQWIISSINFYTLQSSTVLYFRVQSVTGYFQGKSPYIVASAFEGEGSEWAEFTLTLPKNTLGVPTATSLLPSSSGVPSTLDNSDDLQQKSSQFSMVIVRVVVVLCIFVVLLSVAVVIFRRMKPKDIVVKGVDFMKGACYSLLAG
jgi:hypothetical protein